MPRSESQPSTAATAAAAEAHRKKKAYEKHMRAERKKTYKKHIELIKLIKKSVKPFV